MLLSQPPPRRNFSLPSLPSLLSRSQHKNELEISSPYACNRIEECRWEPENVVCKLFDTLNTNIKALESSNNTKSGFVFMREASNNGLTTDQAQYLNMKCGSNSIIGKDEDIEGKKRGFLFSKTKRFFPCVFPVLVALSGQINEPLNLMLLASATISLILGQLSDAISIGVALTIVSLVAAIQEYRSEAALEKLGDLVPHTCTVLRNGRVVDKFLAKDLVVGDLVLLTTGDRVPADCRLIDTIELFLDESSLTGENCTVTKTGSALSVFSNTRDPPLTEQQNIVFMGTLVSSGRGRAIVIAVGGMTEFGKVAKQLGEVESRKSPLQIKIDELGKMLAIVSSAVILLMALLGWSLGRPFLETATVAVSLAVAAIPEGLPICVTVTLALGVLQLARSNAIVKKLTSVETLGCATVVASDKTGTLTENKMIVSSVYTLAHPRSFFRIVEDGNTLNGKIVQSDVDIVEWQEGKMKENENYVSKTSLEFGALRAIFEVACICNNATINHGNDDSSLRTFGQPTEVALLIGAIKANIEDPRPQYHRLQEIPFTSERKRMEVCARPVNGLHLCSAFLYTSKQMSINHMKDEAILDEKSISNLTHDGSLYFSKGMPESVIGECSTYITADDCPSPFTDKERMKVLTQCKRMASSGLRVLAVAYGLKLECLTFAGLIGILDPPRKGVAKAVQDLQEGGVTVVMITGDSKETALAIGKQCGIVGSHRWKSDSNDKFVEEMPPNHYSPDSLNDLEFGTGIVMSGEQLDAIPPFLLADSILGVKIFYRVAPRHKLDLVKAYQSQGEVVAMTGDGVNDATALKAADIGVAMGKVGTDVAKEAADVVLADDDFSTIVKAIAGGKGIFFNIKSFLAFQLSTSFAALSIECIATVLGMPSPLNPMQILWINIIMDGPPAQSLGIEPVDRKILEAKPRRASDALLTKALLLRATTTAALIVFLTLYVFSNEMDDGKISRRATTMTFMTFVNCDLFNAYTCRSSDLCFYELKFFGNPTFILAVGGSLAGQLAVIYFRPLQEIFQTEALLIEDLLFIILLSSTILILDTLRKKCFPIYFSESKQCLPIQLGKKHHSKKNSNPFSHKKEDLTVKRLKDSSKIRNRIPLYL